MRFLFSPFFVDGERKMVAARGLPSGILFEQVVGALDLRERNLAEASFALDVLGLDGHRLFPAAGDDSLSTGGNGVGSHVDALAEQIPVADALTDELELALSEDVALRGKARGSRC